MNRGSHSGGVRQGTAESWDEQGESQGGESGKGVAGFWDEQGSHTSFFSYSLFSNATRDRMKTTHKPLDH